ncbi:MAG: PAS domain-containing protein [Syntrophaceae bacterium]|nr:PAS domain-containing protein [Syntrophaceae bacterium]
MDPNPNLSVESHQKMLKNVKGLMLCRIIILTCLLAITFLFQLSKKNYFFIPMTNHFYYFLILFYLVTIVYAFVLKKVKDLRKFSFIQILGDHLFITGLIYFTGGRESFFPITYVFSIIGSSFIFYRRGAFFSASLSTFLYGLLLLLQLHQVINPLGQISLPDASRTFYSLILYMAAFYIVAFLSSIISEELKKEKKELIQKQVDYDQLETFNRNIVQSLDSGLLTIDLSGEINFLNRTAEKILSRNAEELRNVSIYDLFPKIGQVIDEVKSKGPDSSDYQRYQTLFTNHEGKNIYLGFSISPLTDPEGSLIGHTLIFQDITKFKEMEEEMKRLDKMGAIGLLAAGMAHEIRNPLASLSGSIQMLKSELRLKRHQQQLMEIILRESERLNALITDFLLFAQPPQINRRPYEIQKVIEETVDLLIHSPSFHNGIRIQTPEPPKGIQAMIDPDQMKQVFWNLLLNAVQAMSDGGEIRIELERQNGTRWEPRFPVLAQKRGKEWVRVSITDSGCGIPPEEREKIFEPFFTTKEGGTGLGLSIVHKIIENHNGIIQVKSEGAKGSTFTVFLPVE